MVLQEPVNTPVAAQQLLLPDHHRGTAPAVVLLKC